MAQRIIAIGGEPASGKTTLMKKIMRNYAPLKNFSFGLVRGTYNLKQNLYFIGIYDDSTFSGTDKLSMAVQPHFFKLLDKLQDATIVFEGDRLFNQSLFDKYNCDIIVVEADRETLHKRHKKRADNQTEKFKKAKKTKIANIIAKNKVRIMPNNTEKESNKLYKTIIETINN